jgi:hypothetical protein
MQNQTEIISFDFVMLLLKEGITILKYQLWSLSSTNFINPGFMKFNVFFEIFFCVSEMAC